MNQVVTRTTWFVPGAYVEGADGQVMHGQMFVETLRPARIDHAHPLVLVHGLGQTGTTWTSTPDGRQGWADWLADQGWVVHIVDQPARGRSAWQADINGPLTAISVARTQQLFTPCGRHQDWPQAKRHTQWPGGPNKGRPGDPVFDQFYASQVSSVGRGESEDAMAAAGAALLDKIGPAVLVVHSQAGALGWRIADARPSLVLAIIAIEPTGPPVRGRSVSGPGVDRLWGLTTSPLTYDRAVTPASPLVFEQQSEADGPGLEAGWLQRAPARRLTNLADLPVLVVTGEASYHAQYDHCTVRYLIQAGVAAEHMRLEDEGLLGNGHMMMLELNNLEIIARIEARLITALRAKLHPENTSDCGERRVPTPQPQRPPTRIS